MKKVVVTGATSMIGVALVKRLLQDENIEIIYAVIRSNSDKKARIPVDERVRCIECDIQDYSKLLYFIVDKCEVFYHMAWPRTATYDESIEDMILKCSAVKTVLEVIEVARSLGCRKFVGVGSQSEYGLPPNGKYTIQTECLPVRADGVFHLAAGQIARMAANQLGMKCIWMRVFSVYGINDRPNSMISATIAKLMEGKHCSFTKSEQKWDYVYVDDVAEAFYLVGEGIEENKIYNVAFGESQTLKTYIEIIRDVVEPKAELGIGELEYPSNAVMNMFVDVSDIKKDTNWHPRVDFESGIRKIYENILRGELCVMTKE